MEPRGKAVPRGTATSPESAMASELFDQFVSAATFKSVLHTNRQLCELLRLKPTTVTNFYPRLKAKLHSWRAASLWAKLDKRASHKCYNRGKACPNTRVLIIGAGPCGLRAAIEAQLLGAKVVVLEKRDRFSRNNVLHLWPFVIHDLRNLGAKKFFGKFCAGSIDHISIRQLQIILLKVALLLGVEVHENVGFESLIEPPEDQHERIGWRAQVSPSDHPVSQYEFDVLIGADGKRNTLLGFNRKEFRGKLAIAVTANFINRHSPEEARVPEISGVAFIFNQKFFQDMKEQTSIDLENIVYYKDDTHYFVMTAKKQSLLERGVIIQDYNDTARLLAAENVDREALMEYARDAADFATSYQLPHLDFAVNHYGQADVAMFDFTSMYAAENACRVIERRGHKLLQGLVGDSLLEPFWPTGSGCARGFLSSFDAAWMIRSWASGKMSVLQVLAERESIYRLLAQTTPENLSKDLNQYTLNPSSRYPNLNLSAVLPFQVRSLYDTDGKIEDVIDTNVELPKKKRRRESMIHPDTLLNWCQKQVALSDKVKIQDFTTSWKDGLALCTILNHYRPDLIDINKLDPENVAQNNQLAFDICEKELGIPPVMTGLEMAECAVPDKLTMVSYISQVYESFRGEIPVVSRKSDIGEERTASPSKQFYSTPLSILNKVSNRLQNKRKYSVEKEMAKDKERGENVRKRSSLLTHKRRSREKAFAQDKNQDIILTDYKSIPINKPRESINTRVKNLEEKMKKDAGLRCHVTEESDTVRTPHIRSEQAELNIKMLQQQLQNNGNEANVKKNKVPKVGKLRKDEWNVKIIEEKIKQQNTQQQKNSTPNKPRVYHEIFASKLQQMNEKLKAGGTLTPEEEARYKKFDASLTRLKDRLSKGNLDVGDRGRNQIAAMTDHMTKIWDLKQGRKKDPLPPGPLVKGAVETDSQKSAAGSTVCYFCKERVYLLERLSAEGLFFHRTCFKCEYCNTALRLGDYSFDKDSGGKFYCKPHFRMQKTDLRQQEIMKRKEAFLSCALENQEKEKLYKILLDNTEKALSPRQSTETAKSISEDNAAGEKEKKEVHISPTNLLTEPPNTIPRDQTPERVEYENSIIEMSEDELLVSELEEEELTQKNLGPSQDLATSEDDYSDLSTDSETDEEAFAEELERSLTADETRKLAETWNRKYSAEQSLIYSDSSSSADDEGSDTEIGSDDTSQDIDSDAEYSVEHDEEDKDGVQVETEVENSAMPKTPEEKEFTMEVPVIDLKSMNQISEDDTTSESDSDEITDSEEESDEESGTEVDSESGSESESNPLPPPQIPTIIIYESPPQNPELDQEWNENVASEKSIPCVADNTIILSSDTSAANSGDEQNDLPVEAIAANLDPSETKAEAASAPDDRNADGKFTQLSDMDKNLDSPCSRMDFDVSVVEILETVSSPDLESPLKCTAPLATGESSSDLSISSDIESLAQDIVSGVLKAAQDSILQSVLSSSINSKKETSPPSVVNAEDILIDKTSMEMVCSQSVETPISDLITPEKSKGKEVQRPEVEEIDLCSPTYEVEKSVLTNESKEMILDSTSKFVEKPSKTEIHSVEELPISTEEKLSNENSPSKAVINEKLETKSGFIEENEPCELIKLDANDTIILDDSNEFSSCNESPNDSKNITFRKKNTSFKNSMYEWDSDKSLSFPGFDFDEDIINVDDFIKNDGLYRAHLASLNDSNAEIVEEEEYIPELKKVACANEAIKTSPDITKPSDIVSSCLSQSLPNNSSSFLTGISFPKTVSYTSAEFENAKLGTTEPKSNSKEDPVKLSKETCYNRFADDIMSRSDSAVITSTVSKQETSGLSSSKEETKYKGYSGSFAEKVRPKSLFSDAIYLRSLDIKLQKQPFPSLNKSDDKLDECCKSEDDPVRRKLFDDSNKSIGLDSSNLITSIKMPVSTTACQTPIVAASDVSCLKHKTPVESSDKLPNLSKQKISGHKQSSVSFSTQDSYTDLVSPYTCVQTKTPIEKSFPTKVKPKCDMDISKLRQRREKRKSVHEDIQGLPFADEEKLISPVDPIGSSDVFLTPKELSKPDLLSNVNSSVPSKTPDLIDEDRYLRVQSTVDQEKARQEARARARLKSDEELGLSPNNYRKKYRRQLSLNSINYDELCSDEFCDQDDELEDDIISNICQMKNTGIEDTFNMIKKTELCPRTKTPETPLASSQQFFQPIESKLSSTEDELFLSTDSLDVPVKKADLSQKKVAPVIKPPKHSTVTSSSETSPDICIVEPSFDSKPKTKSKNSLLDGSGEEEKSKNNGKKSIFSILNFGKGNQSKEKARQKSKSSEKDLSSSLPNDIGARSAVKTKPFSNLKLSKSKEKCPKPKSKSAPPESLPTSPLENNFPQEESSNISFNAQLAKTIPKYTVYRNPETTISTFPVHLPVPKMENGLAPKASEDSFSDEDDTQGSRSGHFPSSEKADKSSLDKERRAQRILQKVQRQQVLKRIRNAQETQRRLEELEIQLKELEQQGVEVEKMLRGEGNRKGKTEAELMQEWYTLIHTKNKLNREVQENMIRLKSLELEDRQCKLQQEFNQRNAEGSQKNATQLMEERKILDEMLKIVDQRNELVAALDQLRLKEEEEEKTITTSDVFTKGIKSPISAGEKS
ncbi:F-actin-monooxygenase MICAL3-like [Argiope bruennichi]|uniref:F-actin-monooxygenase MICAL3-like n=1 Tax=Argiope bruennichi TaxID=94029 RepID=UPI0024956134|nr:F-actin-monooxygenase MICAL3-like [Argiope bruennichi]XP_055935060.1 F-actin-monooxygenase MICAL3-like [Argiope bruennichi]XP_055935062.1 F-actin-monooxygenase MICAL3-like [Argiope bruennichi]